MRPRMWAARRRGVAGRAPAGEVPAAEVTRAGMAAGEVPLAGMAGGGGMAAAGAARNAGAGPSAGDILANVAAGVIVVDHDGLLKYANAFAAQLFGYPDAEHLTRKAFRELGFEPDDLGKVEHLERQACRGRDWEGTLSVRRPDGSGVFLRMTASALRADAERVGLLDRIGARLSASLELDATLRQVAETLVPQFADHCFIDLYEAKQRGSGRVLVRKVQVNAWGWEPPEGTWAPVGAVARYPAGHFCRQAIDQRDTILVEDVRESQFPAPSDESMRASAEVGIRSVIAAPLRVRGEDLGVLCLALSSLTEREAGHYVSDDRDLVAAIASRVAIAIDNALLFQEERATAVAFQDSLLPGRPPALDGIEVAYRYVPAKPLESHGQGIQTQVGGDWYDIISLSAGRIGIVIGDVVGRGARAAAIMGQLRSALRAFAQDDKSPAEILRRLDEWCRAMTDERDEASIDALIVTCTYLIYDPWFRRLTIANAGHLPPLMITREGVRPLDVPEDVVLGAGLPTYREVTRELPAGATLIFYTDGLVDRRRRADGPGLYDDHEVLQMLGDAVLSVARESVHKIAVAAEEAVPGKIDDDMAILVVRTSPDDLPYWDHKFPALPVKVSEARRIAFKTFMACGMDEDQADLACLLVSEVVTNVVLHTSALPAPRHELALEAVGAASPGAPGPAAAGGAALPYPDPGEVAVAGEWAGPYRAGRPAAAIQEFTLRIRKGAEVVWVEVFDSDLRLPQIRMAGENDEGGRGLYLVDQLASRWGSRPTEEGKAVWFMMPIRRDGHGTSWQ